MTESTVIFTMLEPEDSHGFRYLRQRWEMVDDRVTDAWFEGSNDMESWVRIVETLH